MTLDEWTDIVARMTPQEREAMQAYGAALLTMEAGTHTDPNRAMAAVLQEMNYGTGRQPDVLN